jgi:exoribonuclease R
MTLYRAVILDRNYASHLFYNVDTKSNINIANTPELSTIIPIDNKLFMDDIFEISLDDPSRVNIVKSIVRNSTQTAGILMLENNKTFGRTDNKKRLLYKCIPDDIHLPAFLIPYEVKLGFTKVQTNKYVTFKFDNWNDKHPRGILTETIGSVDTLDSFYEYQLYCKSLHISLSVFNKKTTELLRQKSHDEYIEQIFRNSAFNIEDHRDRYAFTIDPQNSTDFDDGFHIVPELNDDGICTGWRVTVYIANVFFWLETLGLWSSFSRRVSTIYLPDRRRPMLPTILSDTLCSLQEKQDRFALSMSFFVTTDGMIDKSRIQYKNAIIRVRKNFRYEESKLVENNEHYRNLFNISKLMDKSVRNSHDVVAHWMVQMNAYTGMNMVDRKIGIFRSAVFINADKEIQTLDGVELDEDTCRVIKSWNNTTGQYIAYSDTTNLNHDMLNFRSFKQSNYSKSVSRPYIHITSPIRRLIDLLNQVILCNNYNLVTDLSKDALKFVLDWTHNLDYINATMRSIRKTQTDCNMLHNCKTNPYYLETIHKGIVFDKLVKVNGLFTYMVYLEELKMLSRITCQYDFIEYSYHDFKMFFFEDEHSYKKKIRLQKV